MAEMIRTTGGLLVGQKKTITRRDFRKAVHYMESRGLDEAVQKALGLDVAKQYAGAQIRRFSTDTGNSTDVLDLQRIPGRILR